MTSTHRRSAKLAITATIAAIAAVAVAIPAVAHAGSNAGGEHARAASQPHLSDMASKAISLLDKAVRTALNYQRSHPYRIAAKGPQAANLLGVTNQTCSAP
jgi:hypothetical protein